MHYVTSRSNEMQNHKFSAMGPSVLFLRTVLVPLEHEKYCVDVSCPECTGMHYVTRRSHQMQKHMFDVMCPGVLSLQTIPVPPEYEK
jgi:hypothetical protein